MEIQVTIKPDWAPNTPAARIPGPIRARLSTDHAASSYGIPVLLTPSGLALGPADTSQLIAPCPYTSQPQSYDGPITATIEVPNPGPGRTPPGYTAFLAAAQAAGWRIIPETW